ncbi:MAG: Transcription accessory protein RNA-binding domain [Bacillales bacterium]|jgi:uncharacterized protein|nr:Transcription accessory protein RNA-binding domain [Bacillales bacterium]
MLSVVQLQEKVANELKLKIKQVQSVLALFEEGNTIPFIARYRKEMTESLDEVQIKDISDRWTYLENLEKRKEDVLRNIEEQGKLTPELQVQIEQAEKMQTVEDLYRPYKQKRRTRATVAKENGLEPLALWLMSFPASGSVQKEAEQYVSEKVLSCEDAILGAQDIIAEMISDEAQYRDWIRRETMKNGLLTTSVKNEESDEKKIYEMYYEYEEPISRIVPHRVLAINRGEKEDILKVKISTDVQKILSYLDRRIITNVNSISVPFIKNTIEDSYKRLIEPSIEREIRNELSEIAEDRAIHIFSENLRNLLLQPPMKGKMVLGVDPAYRTGCKMAVVDPTGKMIDIAVIYPHTVSDPSEAKRKFISMVNKYEIEIVTIGNGTASRETEQFVADALKEIKHNIYYIIVNEAGASVYSASEVARQEFPNLHVEERSAVSIARRLQDPLAELVKIDPKSVGVGQYQHDVAEKKLNDSLAFVVETAVNQVGVNVNTASISLLQHVAGLSKVVAQNIVQRRDEEGAFKNRSELKKIPRLGAKTYEQAIGFLRILDGTEPLDRTPIHPEQYGVVRNLLKQLKLTTDLLGTSDLADAINQIDIIETARNLEIGEITLTDILESLTKPERDLRDEFSAPLLKSDVLKIQDLKTGMELQGTVRNVVDFGAFIDIGVKQDGLVHISKLSTKRVKHPMDVVSVGQVVTVWIDQVDVQKGRISLTMQSPRE